MADSSLTEPGQFPCPGCGRIRRWKPKRPDQKCFACVTPFRTHGESKTLLYKTWRSMVRRCSNPRDTAYPNYGGRGITVCERWRASYEAFRDDMGPKPTPHHSIDRIDNNGNYEPGNCRWATRLQQNQNSRRSRNVPKSRNPHYTVLRTCPGCGRQDWCPPHSAKKRCHTCAAKLMWAQRRAS